MITINEFLTFYFKLAEKNLNHLNTHSENTTVVSLALGAELNYKSAELKLLKYGALFHDIGKLFVPAQILNASRKLTVPEFELIKQHTVLGYEILFYFNYFTDIKYFCLLHHFRDGNGYPSELKTDINLDINIDNKLIDILTIADSFTAICEPRIYKYHNSLLDSFSIINNKNDKKNAGINFEILDILKYLIDNNKIILNSYF
jgi:putative nucleotidyltransferase with HDIG domain